MTVVFYSMEKAITTHTDITCSTRQSKQAVFPWMKLSAKINVWCLNRVKNTSQICFFVNFEHPDHWSQLKNVPGGVDGGGWADQLNMLLLLVVPGCHPVLCELPAAPNHLWNQGFAVSPGNFSFYPCCLICVVFRSEISFGGMPALPVLGEPSLRRVRYTDLGTAQQQLGSRKWSQLGAISSNVFRLEMQLQTWA